MAILSADTSYKCDVCDQEFTNKLYLTIHMRRHTTAETSYLCPHCGKEYMMKLAIYIADLPQMLPTKFRFIWLSGFTGEDFLKQTNQKQELPVAAMFFNGSGQNEQSLQRTFLRCFLPSFISFGQAVSEEKLFQKSINQKQELSMTAMFANGSKWNEHFPQRTFHRCFLPSSVYLAKLCQRRFLEIDQSEKIIVCGGHVC